MFCRSCGTQLENVRFCPRCGTSVEIVTPIQQPHVQHWQPPVVQCNVSVEEIPDNFIKTDYEQSKCLYSTPEYNKNLIKSSFKLYISKGTLTLDRGTLVYSSDKGSFEFSIKSIIDIRIDSYSRLQKPVKMNFITIRYHDGYRLETVCLCPMKSLLDSVWKVNKSVEYWMSLIKSHMLV